MKKSAPPASYTASKFAALTGIDRHELQRRLEELKAATGATTSQGAAEYSLRDLVKAYAGGDARAEALRKTRAESERIELQNSRTRGELVEVQKVIRLGQRVMIAVRNRILSFPLTDEEKDTCLRELLSLQGMDWTRDA
jgi:phage terminase Nu1 subunit (DNA packaging protein)